MLKLVYISLHLCCSFSLDSAWLLVIESVSPFSVSTAVSYDESVKAIRVKVPDSDEDFLLHSATVRWNDRSAQSVVRKNIETFEEWTESIYLPV